MCDKGTSFLPAGREEMAMVRANEWNGEPTTLERVTVENLRCHACRARLPIEGRYAIRVNGKYFLREEKPLACHRCRHAQPVPRLFAGPLEVDYYFQTHCGRAVPANDVVPAAQVILDLPRRNGSLTAFME